LFAATQRCATPAPARFDRIAIHTASGVLIIVGLLGNDWLGRSLATAPFRLTQPSWWSGASIAA
jgi:hypothetical protein